MKILTTLTFSLALLFSFTFAQPAITSGVHQWQTGDTLVKIYYNQSGFTQGPSGANVVFNFSNLIAAGLEDSGKIALYPPFPGWNYNIAFEFNLLTNPHNYDFYTSNSDSLSDAGQDHNISDLDPRQNKNPKLILDYQMNYGNNFFDTFSGERQSIMGPITFHGNRTIDVDAWGTLILMQDTIPNILRIRYIDSLWETMPTGQVLYVDTSWRYYEGTTRYELLVFSPSGMGMGNYFTRQYLKTPPCVTNSAAFSDSTDQLDVYFTDMSSGGGSIQSWTWDFGDGNNSALQSPMHTYSAPGNYLVCLSIADSCGTDSVCKQIMAGCSVPLVSFSFSAAGLTVSFSDSTSGTPPLTWAWDFGDGNSDTIQNPSHTYLQTGTYMVCLTVTDLCGTDSVCVSVLADTSVNTVHILKSTVSVWGNPAGTELQVSLSAGSRVTAGGIMYRPDGQEARAFSPESFGGPGPWTLGLEGLASGYYLLVIPTTEGKISVPVVKD